MAGEYDIANENDTNTVKATGSGIAGKYPFSPGHAILVAPSAAGEFNVIRLRLKPIACWRVDDIRFEFGSSFVRPDERDELQDLHALRQIHPGAPLSIFGHADPVGEDDVNKKLNGRRAQSLYGMLVRNTDLWEDLYSNPTSTDKWDIDEIQIMLAALGYYHGPINGKKDDDTEAAVKNFQGDQGLETDGVAGKKTRAKLFQAYMDGICVDREGNPYKLDPAQDFLAQGADKGGKGDYQGCSEFNPRVLFSQEEEQEYKKEENKTKRNSENAPNRRVVAFLFLPGVRVIADKWPCPRVKEGGGGCKKRFHIDGERRRSERNPDTRREYEKTKDTFACRYYDRIAGRSPCEFGFIVLKVRLLNSDKRVIPGARYRLTVSEKEVRKRGKRDVVY